MRSFGILVGTVLLVYFLTPLAVQGVMHWFPVKHPELVLPGVATWATIAVYSILRRVFGDRIPHV